jgi:hypothetical protein
VWLVRRGNHRGTRLAAIAAVASIVLAWGMAQRPYALPTTLTIQAAAGDPDTLRWLLIVTGIAVVLVGPALALLYRLDLTDRLAADHDVDLAAAHAAPEATLTSSAGRRGGRAPGREAVLTEPASLSRRGQSASRSVGAALGHPQRPAATILAG